MADDLGKGATGAKPSDGTTRTATSGPSDTTGAPYAASDQRDDFEEKPDPVSTNPFYPSSSLVVKLGSALVHAEEMSEPGAHPFDLDAFRRLASDPEVVAWREALGAMALLPIKRSAS